MLYNINMSGQIRMVDFCFFELHYKFRDDSHYMDAKLQNNCELNFIRLLENIAKTCGHDIFIEVEPRLEGGLINRYRIATKNINKNNSISSTVKVALITAIFLAPTTIAINGISEVIKQVVDNKMKDDVTDSLEKEKLISEIELLRLDIEAKKEKRKVDSIDAIEQMKVVDFDSVLEDFRGKLIKVNSKKTLQKLRYKFYRKVSEYNKLTNISTTVISPYIGTIGQEYTIDKNEITEFIIEPYDTLLNNKQGFYNLIDSEIHSEKPKNRLGDEKHNRD